MGGQESTKETPLAIRFYVSYTSTEVESTILIGQSNAKCIASA